ncbi:fucolectin-5-like [Mytilus edulis]|uniref:fucolectin-5-like n=1 Tax=Mytilus edulis TaxID=6550 RepID=UPI0039EF8A76
MNDKIDNLFLDCKIPKEEPRYVSPGKISGQSSTYDYRLAGKAVDGLTNSHSHTEKDNLPYWWVDLGNIYNIMRIEVINRFEHGYGSRLLDHDITVGPCLDDMSIFAPYIGPGKEADNLMFQRSRYTDGRFVKLTIIKGPEYLHVAEVIVFSYPEF